jgi:hypothetical protein
MVGASVAETGIGDKCARSVTGQAIVGIRPRAGTAGRVTGQAGRAN